MAFRHSIGGTSFAFADLKELMAKATPPRSGDRLAGVAAATAEENVAAKMALADVPLQRILAEPLVPYEDDDVTRLILDSHDTQAFAGIGAMTVGELREYILSDATSSETLAALAPAITPEMAAAVSKIMRNQDLILAAKKCPRRHALPQHHRPARHHGGAAAAEPSDRRCRRHRRVHRRRPDVRLRRCRDRHQPGVRLAAGHRRPAEAARRHHPALRDSDAGLRAGPRDDVAAR